MGTAFHKSDSEKMLYEQVIPGICNSWQTPVHAIIMFFASSFTWMGISPKLTQVSDVQNNETGPLKSLIEVFVDQSNLHICPIILHREEFFYLKGKNNFQD
ncbi:hypothetical protein Lal_00026321 [Lupinus albus]|nr:hypothetical protein Lal_00026321 [Lupinus albus]